MRASLEEISPEADRIALIERRLRLSTFHLADRDHVGPPYATDYGDATTIDDEGADRQIRSVSLQLATGTATVLRTVTLDGVSVTSTLKEGTVKGASRSSLASPAWWTQDPIRVLRRAADAADAEFVGDAPVHGVPARQVRFSSNGLSVKLSIATGNLLPLAAEVVVALPADIAWSSRGDIIERTEWQNWSLVEGVRLPFQTDVFRNGEPLLSASVEKFSINPTLGVEDFQQDAATLQQLETPGARDVDALPLGRPDRPIREISQAVVQIPGGWYATAVCQPDGIVVIDAPISNGYSDKVIAEITRRFPGTRIKAVVTTTSFNWHTAGVRSYAARGIPIYVLDRNAGVVKALLRAPHRLRPDQLSRSGRRGVIRTVSAATTIGTGATRMVLYPISHATSPMMMVYFPNLQLLHTAEMVQPLGPGGALIFPESLREIIDEVAARGLRVKTVIGMHMDPTPWKTVVDTLRVSSDPQRTTLKESK